MTWNWNLYNGNLEWLKDRTILLCRHGSMAYGTNIEGSDEDIRGVAIAPLNYYFSINPQFEQYEQHEPDITIFAIHKMIKLASSCNPNVIEILFVNDEDILECTPLGLKLIQMRSLFLSKVVSKTFGGYARGQMNKLEISKEGIYKFKPAMHLVRLLRMGCEILETGNIIVRRPDAEELKEIRLGQWSYDKLMNEADALEKRLKIATENSKLPETVDHDLINTTCVNLIRDYYLQ